jgi:hypothetical protein
MEEPDLDLESDEVAEQGDGAGWRSFGTKLRRLPGCKGAPPDPMFKRRSGGGTPAICLCCCPCSGVHRDFFVIFSLLWTFL